MICIGITIGIGPSGALLHTIGIGTIIGIGIGVGQWKHTIRDRLIEVILWDYGLFGQKFTIFFFFQAPVTVNIVLKDQSCLPFMTDVGMHILYYCKHCTHYSQQLLSVIEHIKQCPKKGCEGKGCTIQYSLFTGC